MARSRRVQETLATSNLLGLVDVGAGQWVSRERIVAVLDLATIPEALWRSWAAAPGATERAGAPRSAIVTASGTVLTTLTCRRCPGASPPRIVRSGGISRRMRRVLTV